MREWVIPSQPPPDAEALARALGLPPLIGQLLWQRGLTTPHAAGPFLACDLADLPDPFRLHEMDRAVARLQRALAQRERICVVGDYDVDGLTSAALLVRVLQRLGATPVTYVPHRVHDGYGFSRKAVAFATQQGATVIITVDSGSTAHAQLAHAREQGLDVIVVDHHEMAHQARPPAYALLNPLQPGCPYPEKGLASVGVAFKLAQALATSPQDRDALWDELDLVCLGTVADVAPLVGENRILVRQGLQRLSRTSKVGLRRLMAVADLHPPALTAEHVGFILGPRINAAGRMSAPERALALLLTEDPAEAQTLAEHLQAENRRRQQVEETTLREALAQVDGHVNFTQHRVIVVSGRGWHPGVIGIVAARLVERYHRPAIVVAVADGVGKGSARSIPPFPLVEALAECRQWMLGYGGHEAAAGLTIAEDRLPGFRDAINAVAWRRLDPEALVPRLAMDAEVPLQAVTPTLVEALERLGPFGAGHPRPRFVSRGLALWRPPQPLGRHGVRCWVRQAHGPVYEAVGFDRADGWRARLMERTEPCALAYTPALHHVGGEPAVQLTIHDVQ